jgi:CubicO group peptidase (beta-lactamase class C family)
MPTFTPQDFDRIRAAARALVEDNRLPGLSIGVVSGDDLVFAEAFGHADIESKEPLHIERRQRIASITKTMVGLCAMAVVDEDKLRLEDRVVDLLPEVAFEGPAEAMTVRHLLTHTSGIGEAPTIEGLRDVSAPDRSKLKHAGEFGELYPKGVVVEVPPGEKWAYCNNGYALLGEIIQRAEKAQLQDIMQRRIWGPLGMTSTAILDVPDDRVTTPYHRATNDDTRFQLERAGIPVREEQTVDGLNIRGEFTPDFNKAMRAAGGVQSNVPDMAKYASALLRNGTHVVRPETFDAMVAPQCCPDERLVSWGLSFSRIPRFGRMLIGHGGAYFGGWNSRLDVIPAEGIGIIQHMNIMLDEPSPVFRRIWQAVLDAPAERFAPQRLSASTISSAPGEYLLPMPGPLTNFRPATRTGRIRIEQDGDGLRITSRWGKWKTGVPLLPCDGADSTLFAVSPDGAAPAYLALTRDDAGEIDGLRIDDLVHYRKTSPD